MKRFRILAWFIVFMLLVLGIPAVVLAQDGDLSKFQAYVKALEYGLEGLKAYFDFIVELFKTAIS